MRTFTALYTHQKQKKAKVWQEGTVYYNSKSNDLILFDDSNQRITSHRLRVKESIKLSHEYDIGRFLLSLEAEVRDDATAESAEATAPTPASATGALRGVGALRRVKKLSSLIQPMKIKATVPVSGADEGLPPAAKEQPVSPAAPELISGAVEYTVLYTTQKVKKVKAWAEGTLTFFPAEQRIRLKGEDGGTLTSTHLPKSKVIEVDGELDVGIYLIQIQCIKGDEGGIGSTTTQSGLQLQGALKRRHEALAGDTTDLLRPGIVKSGLQRIKLQKRPSELASSETTAAIVGEDTVQPTLPLPPKPVLTRAGSGSSGTLTRLASAAPLLTTTAVRTPFSPPTSQTPIYLHFPRRGELLQHVSVSKGYGLGPSRQLTAPVSFAESIDYQQKFAALLRENLMAELSALAIRYFFMARERFEATQGRQESGSGMSVGKRRGGKSFGAPSSFPQACKSVGVLFFDECTMRQPFMDSTAFKAQSSRSLIVFAKGDNITLELSRRENYAGYAKDDTWAISVCTDFKTETTFLARSVFYGPSKNNILELALVGEEDAKVATRIFNADGHSVKGSKRHGSAGFERKAPSVVAIRCLDSASDWSMLDTVEAQLSTETMPLLPHLLQADIRLPPPRVQGGVDPAAILARIDEILDERRIGLGINDEQFVILRQVVMSAVSIYLPVDGSTAVTIVHGPFGTGKSFLVSAIVICLDTIADEFPEVFGGPGGGSSVSLDNEAVDSDPLADSSCASGDTKQRSVNKDSKPRLRVLVSSMTNFAVDNMLCALLKQGYDQFLRVGNLKRISKQVLPYVCRSSSGATDDIRDLEAMLEEASSEVEQEAIHTAIQRLRHQRVQDALESAFVIGTTCLSAATAVLRSESFPVVILDEACQIVEPMALIALANAGCQRLVLVGDPLQLPPTLTTRATKSAEGKGLDRALFDRLVQLGHGPRFLSTQYRCHPRIGSLCNQLFYEGRLQHGVSPADRQPMIPSIPPLAFLDTAGQEKQHGKSQSFFNKGEIDMAVQLVRRLLLGGVEAESIGVIALYKTQADMLQEQLCGHLGQRNRVQVSTVDAYQGSEREIIIISCVRTEKIGFIANPNRVNVALSRARRHCLVLGARKLLETNSMWRRILEYCRQDDDGLGVVSAQSFLNRLASAVANNVIADDNDDGDHSIIASPAMDLDLGLGRDIYHSPANDIELESDQQAISTDLTAIADDEGEESVAECEYGDEGVVGGSLSQWSMPGICIDLDDGDDDVLDCLDVDADDM